MKNRLTWITVKSPMLPLVIWLDTHRDLGTLITTEVMEKENEDPGSSLVCT